MVNAVIAAHWNLPTTRGETLVDLPGFTVMVDATLGEKRRVVELIAPDGSHRFSLRSEAAEALALRTSPPANAEALLAALAAAGERFHDWELVFYLSPAARQTVEAEAAADGIRVITAADAELFKAFEAANTEDDLEEAYVEADHWLAVAHLGDDGAITAAASAYPWDGTLLADVGVITAPGARGKGLATAVVRTISRLIIERGYEPQYRCQDINMASQATANRSGYELFARWRVVTGDDPEA